jgi:ubiquitin C
MQIFVRTFDCKTVTLDVENETVVEDVKDMLNRRTGAPAESMRIMWSGKQLEDGRTMAEYGIVKEATLHLVMRAVDRAFIYVLAPGSPPPGQRIFICDGLCSTTLLKVKQEIENKMGFPLPEQGLIFAGKVLDDDDETLAAYHVGLSSTLHLVLRHGRVRLRAALPGGEVLALKARASDTVDVVAQSVRDAARMPWWAPAVRLTFNGARLAAGATLAACHVGDGATLSVSLAAPDEGGAAATAAELARTRLQLASQAVQIAGLKASLAAVDRRRPPRAGRAPRPGRPDGRGEGSLQ